MLGLLDFMFAPDYEERKIARFEEGDLIVDTCFVTDSDKPCETAIQHPEYNKGKWIIVESYDNEVEARIAHEQWVKIMTGETLPDILLDKGLSGAARLSDVFRSYNWRVFFKGNQRPENPSNLLPPERQRAEPQS